MKIDHPFWNSFVDRTGKLNRLQYLGRLLILSFIFLISQLILTSIISAEAAVLILAIPQIYCVYAIIQQRVRSMGNDPSLTWLWLLGSAIPIVNFIVSMVLLFKRPQEQPTSSILAPKNNINITVGSE